MRISSKDVQVKKHPIMLLLGLLCVLLPISHAYHGSWTSSLQILASLLVFPTIGLAVLRARRVKLGELPPAKGHGSRLLLGLSAVWASGPFLLLGDDRLYSGSGGMDVLAFLGSAAVCELVALALLGSTVRPNDAEPRSRPFNVLAALGVIGVLLIVVNVVPPEPVPAPAAAAATIAPTAPATTVTTTPPASSSPAPPPPPVLMPGLTGVLLTGVRDKLPAGIGWDHEDRSPRGRGILVERNWTVVETEPAKGQPLRSGQQVRLYVLKNEEAAWFAKHPTMPKIKPGTEGSDLIGQGEPLDGIWELVEYRYPKGKAPKDARDPHENLKGWEPPAEKAARAGLKEAYSSFGLVVGTIPAAGQKVRPGRLIVVTLRDKPLDDSPGGSGSIPDYNNGDDDFNVPGWLCPTRFC
ncbi:PASTA domain-containing protein [Actinoplanes sp. NPDC000266]